MDENNNCNVDPDIDDYELWNKKTRSCAVLLSVMRKK
jgi:hypothetical protein